MDDRTQPLVSIIAISYNHAPYIQEALNTVIAQSYKNIEVIIVDDCSTDAGASIIRESIIDKDIIFIQNQTNIGNCKSFNNAYKLSKGKYIIDFALDDILYPEHVARQVALFETVSENTGVVFSNVQMIDEKNEILYTQYPTYHHSLDIQNIPVGNVFEAVLSRYYINPVSMMFRREVMDALNGYDESLSYEDFDFWIRSARIMEYAYLPEITCAKRITSTSLSSSFYKKNQTAMFESTLQVSKKAWWLCATKNELKSLVHRCRYEALQAYKYHYTSIVKEYLGILKVTDPLYYFYVSFIYILLVLKHKKITQTA